MAGGLRFWQLGEVPPGLYRDEATNGLDALEVLTGQRQGQSPFYFEGNNGREPAYIYLSSLSIYLFGRTTLAIRLIAAVTGTLTTWITYKLASAWFGRNIGLLSAWVWAITIWPIHLSRIGLRPILLPLLLAITFWMGTVAYRRSRDSSPAHWLWLLTGIAFGASFYTYLVARFTIIVFTLLGLYLVATGRRRGLWPGIGWAVLGAAVTLTPLAILTWQQPDLILGRTGQVSILSPAVNQGDVFGTLWRQTWQALGLFFVKGDTIVRHNPPGRPVFDLLMLIPFLLGTVWCLRYWRRAPAMALLLWVGVMLGPTILAEDSPHFLRAVGILPGLLLLPAIGLWKLWTWSRLPSRLGQVLAVGLLSISLLITVNDYFFDYGRQPSTAYWFEAAARDLAERVNDEPDGISIYVDRRFNDSWPSVPYLLQPDRPVTYYRPEQLTPDQFKQPAVLYAWPYEQLGQVVNAVTVPALVSGTVGSLAQGDLEPAPYPLFIRYAIEPAENRPILANFDNTIQLRGAEVTRLGPKQLQIDLYWSTDAGSEEPVVAFVHLVDPDKGVDGLIGQSDNVPGQGYWPNQWWQSGLTIHDQHIIELKDEYDINQQQILVGLYYAGSTEQLPILTEDGLSAGDTWLLRP